MASNDDLRALERVVEKLDDSIEKLTEVSNNVGKLLAVHDQRLDTIEKDTTRNEDDIRDIHYKIDGMVKDITLKIDESMRASAEGHAKIQHAMEEKVKTLDARVKVLEIWRWLVIGGALVIGWLVNRLFK